MIVINRIFFILSLLTTSDLFHCTAIKKTVLRQHLNVSGPKRFENTTVRGSITGRRPKKLTRAEFLSLQTNPKSRKMSSWLGIITGFQSNKPKVHIIDINYYKNAENFNFTSKYGIHENYARHNGFAANTKQFLKKVQGSGKTQTIIPFSIHFPNDPSVFSTKKAVNWVFQIKRYRYKNRSRSFAKALEKAQHALTKRLRIDFGRPHIAVYTRLGSFRRPNLNTHIGRRDIAALKNIGFDILSVNDLFKDENPSQLPFTLLNGGSHRTKKNRQFVTHGYLRHITDNTETGSGPTNVNILTERDIALFDQLPEHVVPVAGIIVLERQTPLSHVNILAQNRGTMNISLIAPIKKRAQLPKKFLAQAMKGFRPEFINQPVKITASHSMLKIERSTKKSVNRFVKAHRQGQGRIRIEKPHVFDSKRWVLDPAKEALTAKFVGAKAAHYGLMQNTLKNLHVVMPGRAIGFNLYLETIQIAGPKGKPIDLIQSLIRKKNKMNKQQIKNQLVRIQKAIMAIPLADIPHTMESKKTVVDEIAEMLTTDDYKNVGRIRLRSSTNCEDLPKFNGAGLYTSKGVTVVKKGRRVVKRKKIWNRLKSVLASLWLSRAYFEREYFGIDHAKAAMAIQINPAFSDKWLGNLSRDEWGNGVIIYDERQKRKHYHINSQRGEASVTNPRPGEISESFIIESGRLKLVHSRSEVQKTKGSIFLDAHNDTLRNDVESRDLLEKLTAAVKMVFDQEIINAPTSASLSPNQFGIDIEFKIMMDKHNDKKLLYIKQARPINLGCCAN